MDYEKLSPSQRARKMRDEAIIKMFDDLTREGMQRTQSYMTIANAIPCGYNTVISTLKNYNKI